MNGYQYQICSPEHPMPQGDKGRWQHTNTEEVGDQEDGWPGGDIQKYRCKDCGHTWKEELPQ
jgi:rubrerythrin